MRIALTDHVIDVTALIREVSDESCGAAVAFLGTVREVNDDRAVTGIEYSAYRSMAEREMAAIGREASERFGVLRLVVEHRLGTLRLGEVSVAVVVAHPHRAPALDANRYVIEEIKRRVPIWKLEHYADGTREWVGANASSGNRDSEIDHSAVGSSAGMARHARNA